MVRGWLKRAQRLIDHDPEIDRFKTLWREEHLKETDFAILSGLNPGTIHRMFNNETKRPQHLTYAKMASALGHEYTLTRVKTPDYQNEIPKAREEFKEHLAVLKKKRGRNGKKKNGK
jgi:hypothetical protein